MFEKLAAIQMRMFVIGLSIELIARISFIQLQIVNYDSITNELFSFSALSILTCFLAAAFGKDSRLNKLFFILLYLLIAITYHIYLLDISHYIGVGIVLHLVSLMITLYILDNEKEKNRHK